MKVRKLTAVLMAMVMVFSLLYSSAGSINVRAAETEDENYGDETELPTGTVALPEGVIDYSGNGSQHRECRQIPNEKQKGIYFLNDNKLSFYSFVTGELELVYTFKTWLSDSYVAGGKLYTLGSLAKEIDVYDLDAMDFERTISLDFAPTTVGVDNQGRIYVSDYASFNATTWIYEESWIYLLTPEGKLITKAAAPNRVNDFGGFDSVTGNFYFELDYYYGVPYSVMGALGAGNVSGDSMEVYDGVIQTFNGTYTMDKQRPIDLLGDKYLCVDSPYCLVGEELDIRDYWESLIIRDSHETDVSAQSFPLLAALKRDYSTNRQYIGYEMVGSRCVYNEENDSIISYIDSSTLSEYSMKREAFIGSYRTAHPVFSLDMYGDYVVAIERDEDGFYLEMIEWKHSDKLEIANGSSRMKAGETIQLEVVSNGTIENEYTWKTSNPTAVSITKNGKISAWHEGTATITVSNEVGLSASLTITVEARAETGDKYPASLTLAGEVSSNVSRNDYSQWAWSSNVYSYLMENADGTLTRVESMGTYVLIEKYDKAGALMEKGKTISPELPIFGGFYSGEEYNYLVFGQTNYEEDDEAEVVRIVKYSKDWNRLGAASVKGANTYIPFDAGCLRMTETAGRLYIHTSHEMYKSSDGYHHQANMTFVIDESTMEIVDSFYIVRNLSVGYVSHSFNQFIQTDGNDIYRVDHGDAYPRAVTLTRCAVGDKIWDVTAYTKPFEIDGETGFNYTGVSVGGFELSSDNCLIAGNSVKQEGDNTNVSGQRNIFLTVTDKDLNNTKILWFTNYANSSNVEVRTPQLVKLGEDQFLLMWEERNISSGSIVTRMVTIDGYGNHTSDVNTSDRRLSDCHPIVGADGLVRWYQSDGAKVTLYTVDPLAFSAPSYGSMMGDVDGDRKITADDALCILKYKAGLIGLNGEQQKTADTDGDGKITADDALLILKYKAGLVDKLG